MEVVKQKPHSAIKKSVSVWKEFWTQPNNDDCGLYAIFSLVYLIDNNLLESVVKGGLRLPAQEKNFGLMARQHVWIVLYNRLFDGANRLLAERLRDEEDGLIELSYHEKVDALRAQIGDEECYVIK